MTSLRAHASTVLAMGACFWRRLSNQVSAVRVALLLAMVLGIVGGGASSARAQWLPPRHADMVIDEARQRIYASSPSLDQIQVYSLSTLEQIDAWSLRSWPTGLALAPDGTELAVALERSNAIAFVNLDATSVVTRVVPALTGSSRPSEVVYGRPGRLYAVGLSPGITDHHVYAIDTVSKTVAFRSTVALLGDASLALAPDWETLFVAEDRGSVQNMFRFDVRGDVFALETSASTSNTTVRPFCVKNDGALATAPGEWWTSDLQVHARNPNYSGGKIICSRTDNRLYVSGSESLQAIDGTSGALLWRYSFGSYVSATQLNAAGTMLYSSTDAGLRSFSTSFGPRVFLPQVVTAARGIRGRVLLYGQPLAGATIQLRLDTAASGSTIRMTTTDPAGQFDFVAPPNLATGQHYTVLFDNALPQTPRIAGALGRWTSRPITEYSDERLLDLGVIDLGDVVLTSPPTLSAVRLPVQFQWVPRVQYPEDQYAFHLFVQGSVQPYFASPSLGQGGSYTLTNLPPGFTTGRLFWWKVVVRSPDGAVGESGATQVVTFLSPSLQALPSLERP